MLILVLNAVILATRAQVSFLVIIDLKLVSQEAPDADIELTVFVQQWLFDILLNDPVVLFERKNMVCDLFRVFENFNAAALVQCCWFDHPHVFEAVFVRYTFVAATSARELTEAAQEKVNFAIILRTCHNVGRRCRIKSTVTLSFSFIIVFVVVPQRLDQVRLCADPM